MRKQILTIALLIVLIGSLSRLSIAGWFFILGVLSIVIFGIIHITLHYNLIGYGVHLKKGDIWTIGLSHILYLNLFLFQSDGGDDKSYVLIEYLFGRFGSFELERYASSIFTVSLVLYFITAAVLFIRLKMTNPAFSKKRLKLAILVILAVIILPIGTIYIVARARDLKDMKADEKLGKYENLKRALRNKKNVRYLRLYRYPRSYTNIPKGVFKLYQLEELEMYSNEIGEISKEISLLKTLKIIDLQYNQIKTLPDEIYALPKLEKLVLINNLLDSISEKICECKTLKVLYIGGPSLKAIPSCLSALTNLEKLVVQSDSINNYMDMFSAFENLKELDLYTYKNSIRDNKKYIRLKQALPDTKMDIPSFILNPEENKSQK